MSSAVSVPFAEHPWVNGLPSPYYNESHKKWQQTCRKFITENMAVNAMEWERAGQVPNHVFDTFAKNNFMIAHLPFMPIDWLKRLGLDVLPGGLKAEEFDYMHCAIFISEMSKCGITGPPSSLAAGFTYGIPPILKFGSKELQEKFLPDLLTGKKKTCIAITEPDAGSDVANIQTTAKKSKDGKYYIIDGAKKWITNGIWSDYATMAVRTGGPGPGGLSLLVVPLKAQGVDMRKIRVQGPATSGTTYIELDQVKVPVENLIGKEGMGMNYVMTNFNHERLTIAVGVCTQARAALSSAFAYVQKREAFGKPLMDQPVVRNRLARAGAELESLWSWIESFCYQMCHLSKQDADRELGGLTALVKAKAGMVLQTVADTSLLLFGGNGYTSSGQGELVEQIYRDVMGARIPGGSEDVMLDLAIRQLVKNFQRKTKELEKSSKL